MYLLVHSPGGNRLFENFETRHAEEKFMEVYGEKGNIAGNKRVKLDVYLTYAPCGIKGKRSNNCATKLIAFAGKNNFELNIKTARPRIGNGRELSELMASPYCTVEAFRKKGLHRFSRVLGFSTASKLGANTEAGRERL